MVVPVKVNERDRIRRGVRAQKHMAAGSVGFGQELAEPRGQGTVSPEQKWGEKRSNKSWSGVSVTRLSCEPMFCVPGPLLLCFSSPMDFPVEPMVTTPCFHCRCHRSDLWLGKLCMLRMQPKRKKII